MRSFSQSTSRAARSRDRQLIRQGAPTTGRSGRAAGSVGASTDHVVLGESPGEELHTARALGFALLTEGELRKLVQA
ncbi:hypothetical protein [Sorangium sp. So ce124]|uniref:hypothetical protein n=1 Tax=Sorangium sp. So ce124 TaxID=3133280 RepID=UPI003F6192E3